MNHYTDNISNGVLKLSMFVHLGGKLLIHDLYDKSVYAGKDIEKIFFELLKTNLSEKELIEEKQCSPVAVELLKTEKYVLPLAQEESSMFLPLKVSMETMQHCNAQCVFCPQHIERKGRNVMSDETFEIVLNRLKPYSPQSISFTHYNEPLLDKKFKERVIKINENNLKLFLFTNATHLTDDLIHFLCDSNLYGVIFNFPSLVESEWVNFMHLSPKFYHKARTAIENFVSSFKGKLEKYSILVNGISEDQIRRTNEIREHFQKFGDIDIEAWISHSRAGAIENESVTKRINTIRQKFGGCDRIAHNLHISYDGKVFLCCQDYHQKIVLGDLLTDDIKTIMESENAKSLRAEIFGEKPMRKDLICRSCVQLRNWKVGIQ